MISHHGYGNNIVNLKITQTDDLNWSDDQLCFLAYATFYWSGGQNNSNNPVYSLAKAFVDVSLERTFRNVRDTKPALYDVIYAAVAPDAYGPLADALWCLRSWPVSLINWPIDNSERHDVRREKSGRLLDTAVRYDETSVLQWNANAADPVMGSGFQEMDPGAFLLPYWMARYYNLLT